MKYVKVKIRIETDQQDQLIADLSEFGFSGFQQFDNAVLCYISKENYSNQKEKKINKLLSNLYAGSGIESTDIIEEQNWNDEWEQTLTPQFVGQFFIKPSWSEIDPPSDATLLLIDPKMSFGTGYHETTRLILRKIPSIIQPGDKVLDAGTGTGILAIAAAKTGADWVFGFDIDEWSYRNASENIKLNDVEDKISLALGDQDEVPAGTNFDVVIANINRSVILPMLPVMLDQLRNDGTLLLSGLTKSDRTSIESAPSLKKLATLVEVTQEGEWICMTYRKASDSSSIKGNGTV